MRKTSENCNAGSRLRAIRKIGGVQARHAVKPASIPARRARQHRARLRLAENDDSAYALISHGHFQKKLVLFRFCNLHELPCTDHDCRLIHIRFVLNRQWHGERAEKWPAESSFIEWELINCQLSDRLRQRERIRRDEGLGLIRVLSFSIHGIHAKDWKAHVHGQGGSTCLLLIHQ